jgi:threonine synthase
VSPFQEAQMATLGGNVTAVRVPGTFDDCQRLVKQAFLDPSLGELNLSSANSINIGRLLPQTVYYFASWLALGGPAAGDVVFAVPSGNLGNLTAGVIAQRIGLPVRRFLAACNVNDVLPEYLRTGTYRARPAAPTISNAMDVGDPSNFPRLAELHERSLEAMRANLTGASVSEEDTRRAIRQAHDADGYVLDPHSAVAFAAALQARQDATRTDGGPGHRASGEVRRGDSRGTGACPGAAGDVARLGVAPADGRRPGDVRLPGLQGPPALGGGPSAKGRSVSGTRPST